MVDDTEDALSEYQEVKHRSVQLHEELERVERNWSVLQEGAEAEEETLRDTESAVQGKAHELESLQKQILQAQKQQHTLTQELTQQQQYLHAADASTSAVNEELQHKLQG